MRLRPDTDQTTGAGMSVGLRTLPGMVRSLEFSAYLDHLAADSARFSEVLRRTPYDSPVPTCPGWTAADLFFHLAEVQNFWARIVGRRLTTSEQVAELKTVRPDDDRELPGLFAECTQSLQEALRATPPDTVAWTWAPEQTAGFSYRRQAQEALMHRLDAELTAGERTPLDPRLAADGVDEMLGVMYGEAPSEGTFTPSAEHIVRFAAVDTGDSWTVTIGTYTDPAGESSPCLDWAPHAAATAEVQGTAADLDCWLWRRPPVGQIDQTGSPATLARLAELMSEGLG